MPLGREPFWFELIGELALSFLPIAIADAARMRRERWHERIEREADTRVQDERLRIARDLHDTVAHGLSTIAVQSGVASHLLQRDPGQARQALDAINSASKDSLAELRAMVGVLRSTDEAPRQPTAWDPSSVGDLVAAAERNGCKVELQVGGAFPIDASNAALVACLRILQEALTNVARHAGPVATAVNIHDGDRTVELRVENAPSAGRRDDIRSTGVGITGMAERAKALGGLLTAAPTASGGFSVWAMIPYHPAE